MFQGGSGALARPTRGGWPARCASPSERVNRGARAGVCDQAFETLLSQGSLQVIDSPIPRAHRHVSAGKGRGSGPWGDFRADWAPGSTLQPIPTGCRWRSRCRRVRPRARRRWRGCREPTPRPETQWPTAATTPASARHACGRCRARPYPDASQPARSAAGRSDDPASHASQHALARFGARAHISEQSHRATRRLPTRPAPPSPSQARARGQPLCARAGADAISKSRHTGRPRAVQGRRQGVSKHRAARAARGSLRQAQPACPSPRWRAQPSSAQRGGRLSKKAAIPSAASSLSQRATSASTLRATCAASTPSESARTSALASATAPGAARR